MDSEDSSRSIDEQQDAVSAGERDAAASPQPEEGGEGAGQEQEASAGGEGTTGVPYVETLPVGEIAGAGTTILPEEEELVTGGLGSSTPLEAVLAPPAEEPSGAGAEAPRTGKAAAGAGGEPELIHRAGDAAARIGAELGQAASRVERMVTPVVEQATARAGSLLQAVMDRGKKVISGEPGDRAVMDRAGEVAHRMAADVQDAASRVDRQVAPVMERASEVAHRVVDDLQGVAARAEHKVTPMVEQATARASSLLHAVAERGKKVISQVVGGEEKAGEGVSPPTPAQPATPEPSAGPGPEMAAEPLTEPTPAVERPALDRAAQVAQKVAGELGEAAQKVAGELGEAAQKVAGEVGEVAARAEKLVTPVVDKAAARAGSLLRSVVEQGKKVIAPKQPNVTDEAGGEAGSAQPLPGASPEEAAAAPAGAAPAAEDAGGAAERPVLDRAAQMAQKVAGELGGAAQKVAGEVSEVAARAEKLVTPVVDKATARAGSLLRS
ncbi:MAG: hypothetical protein FJ125_14595, partial [Deltaproteobacteria bacterium]|nr:hypothetical protein [Deltaproteobacteria bacterium]